MPDKQCPHCGKWNAADVRQCACGYEVPADQDRIDPLAWDQIETDFKKRLVWQIIALIFAVILLVGTEASGNYVVGTVMLIGIFAFSLWNWRCPSCRSYLGRNMYPKYCPICKVQLHL